MKLLAYTLLSALMLGTTALANTGPYPARSSFGLGFPAMADGGNAAAASYCQSTGGVVQTRVPVYGTNNSNPKQQLVLSGSAQFCAYTAKGASIYLFLSTLYTTQPTLAALAYYSKTPESASCKSNGGSPGSCYCSQLGGTDLFGGITAAGGAWVLKSNATDDLDTCIFPDLSSIDSFGLFYHSAGIVRGKDLAKVLRYHKPR